MSILTRINLDLTTHAASAITASKRFESLPVGKTTSCTLPTRRSFTTFFVKSARVWG